MSTLRGVNSPAPLVLCPVDMASWIGLMGIPFTLTSKEDWHSSFIHGTRKFDHEGRRVLKINCSIIIKAHNNYLNLYKETFVQGPISVQQCTLSQ